MSGVEVRVGLAGFLSSVRALGEKLFRCLLVLMEQNQRPDGSFLKRR